MKILSYRRQIISDHSSTNYLFYSPKPLSKEVRTIVGKLSSHVDVRAHTAEITYHGDFADLGEDRRNKFLQHYDVEVQESYDWWSISIMLEIDRITDSKKVMEYEEERGEAILTFEKIGKRLRLRLAGCHLDYNNCYKEFGEHFMEGMAELAIDIREELYTGKMDALEVGAVYCRDNEVPDNQGLTAAAEILRAVLAPI
jgi:hypothetical protein